ncbi:MAG: hypothetical protein WCG25_09775 [bacterium]
MSIIKDFEADHHVRLLGVADVQYAISIGVHASVHVIFVSVMFIHVVYIAPLFILNQRF